jgi:hypothetical protein
MFDLVLWLLFDTYPFTICAKIADGELWLPYNELLSEIKERLPPAPTECVEPYCVLASDVVKVAPPGWKTEIDNEIAQLKADFRSLSWSLQLNDL